MADIVLKRMAAGDEAGFAVIAPEVFDAPVVPERLAAYLTDPHNLMILAFDGDLAVGQCAGVIHTHPDKPTELYVDEVGVAPAYRLRGIARAMMEALFAWGREKGCTQAWLGTEPDNLAAMRLYDGLDGEPAEAALIYCYDL